MWETQAATDRLYKLWDTEETPRLLLLAPAFSAATAQPNIWVNKAADLPDPHQGRASCLTGRMSGTNDALRPTHANTKWHCVWSRLRLEVMVFFEPHSKPEQKIHCQIKKKKKSYQKLLHRQKDNKTFAYVNG